MHFTVRDKVNIINCDIIRDIIDEMRRQRKIMMVIKDDNVDEYINLDMTELNIIEASKNDSLSKAVQWAC